MAWRTEKNAAGGNDIVIDGWEKGIADDPYEGIADLRNINILSTPREGSVNFASAAVTLPPVLNTTAFTCAAADNRITIATTAGFYEGMAIIINTLSGGTGLSATAGSNTFYVTNITATTFQVSVGVVYASVVDITLDGSGTLSTAQLGTPQDSTLMEGNTFSVGVPQQFPLILDTSGQLWMLGNGTNGTTVNRLYFCGNTNHTSTAFSGLGLAYFKGYVFVFIGAAIDYITASSLYTTTGPNGNWVIAWQALTAASAGHKALSATDDALYFCNSTTVGAILENAGSTFDPSSAATYTYNASALSLPSYDYAQSLAQLGTNLLVGGVLNYIYPWDRVSTSFNYPIVVAESNIKVLVSSNSNAYIFAGNRGYIYITNGANVEVFKKFPDQLSGTSNPYYAWGTALYYRNQLYFSISARTNGLTTISNFAGVWGIDLETDVLRLETSLSYGTYAGTVPVLVPSGISSPTGYGMYMGWLNSTGGIDYTASTPYTNYEAYIDTDMIPVGTYFNPATNAQIEYKLSKPLVTGESLRIAWRGNLTDAFTTVATFTTVGLVADATQVNFQKQQWAQLRISLASTASSPSYNRLREIRMR